MNRGTFSKMNKAMTRDFEDELVDCDDECIFLSHLKIMCQVSKILCYLRGVASFVYLIGPMVAIVRFHLHPEQEIVVHNKGLPVFTNLTNSEVQFLIEYAIGVVGSYGAVFGTASADALFIYYSMMICGFYECLGNGYRGLQLVDRAGRGQMKNLIEKHQILVNCRKYFEKIFGPVFLMVFITSATILCTLAYQLYAVKEKEFS